MSVRQSLLAILDQGPCYGYQLRAEFDRRTGSTWPLNVGQIYNTLDRLERDGLVAKGETDEQGHVYYEITDAGSAEVAAWLALPRRRVRRARATSSRSSSPSRPPCPASTSARSSAAQRARLARPSSTALTGRRTPPPRAGRKSSRGRSWSDAMILHAEAELRWLDRAEQRLARHPEHAMALELATERPKRGRPRARPSGGRRTAALR